MEVVALIIAGLAIGVVGLGLGYWYGARRTQEVMVAAITLSFNHRDERHTFDELIEEITYFMSTKEGARAVVDLLQMAREER